MNVRKIRTFGVVCCSRERTRGCAPTDTSDMFPHVPVGADPCVCPGREAANHGLCHKNYDVHYTTYILAQNEFFTGLVTFPLGAFANFTDLIF